EEPLESDHPERRFKELARIVARFLRLEGAALREALDGVQVYTAGDLSFLQTLSNRGFSKKEIHTIERQILARESYYIPRARIAYLANLSVNHAAEEATHFHRHSDAELFNAVTHSLGYILGERLYYGLARGRILKPEVRALFLDPLDEDGAPFLTYFDLSTRLADVRIPRRN